MFGFFSPERRSRAGVWSAPQEATTARERTVIRFPSQVTASTPQALPSSIRTRCARARTSTCAPRPAASASQVRAVDCLPP